MTLKMIIKLSSISKEMKMNEETKIHTHGRQQIMSQNQCDLSQMKLKFG